MEIKGSMDTANIEYTLLVAFKGSYTQLKLEADSSFEALQKAVAHIKAMEDDDRQIIGITITNAIAR